MAGSETSDGETDLLEAIEAYPSPFKEMAVRVHDIVTENAPSLTPRTWYGMPAYEQDGATVCFFRVDDSYMTFGLTEKADLSPDAAAAHQLIPSAWYFSDLDEATADELARIVRSTVG